MRTLFGGAPPPPAPSWAARPPPPPPHGRGPRRPRRVVTVSRRRRRLRRPGTPWDDDAAAGTSPRGRGLRRRVGPYIRRAGSRRRRRLRRRPGTSFLPRPAPRLRPPPPLAGPANGVGGGQRAATVSAAGRGLPSWRRSGARRRCRPGPAAADAASPRGHGRGRRRVNSAVRVRPGRGRGRLGRAGQRGGARPSRRVCDAPPQPLRPQASQPLARHRLRARRPCRPQASGGETPGGPRVALDFSTPAAPDRGGGEEGG